MVTDTDTTRLDYSDFESYRNKRDELVQLIASGSKTGEHTNGYVSVEIDLPFHLFSSAYVKQDSPISSRPVEVNVYALIRGRNYPEAHATDYRELVAFDDAVSNALGAQRALLGLHVGESEDYVYSAEFESLREAIDRVFDVTDAILSIVQRGVVHQDIEELLEQVEGEFLEFKLSLTCDMQRNERNKEVEHKIAKALCAFMNHRGGTLLIGVENNGKAVGVERDMNLLHRNGKDDKDVFDQKLTQMIQVYLGPNKRNLVHLSWETIEGKAVARVKTDQGDTETFVDWEEQDEFYVRLGNISQPLRMRDAVEYIKKHWPRSPYNSQQEL
jgi:hypothetical protein